MGDRPENEMEQIHKGLEEFLERELQLYTIEDEKKQEKELDIIGGTGNSGSRQGTAARKRMEETYQFYEEDWDQPRSSQNSRSRNTGNIGRSESRSSESPGGSSRNTGASRRTGSTKVTGSNRSTGSRSSKSSRSTVESSGSAEDQKRNKRKVPTTAADEQDKRSRRSEKPKKKKKSRLKRFLIVATLVVCLILFGIYQLVGVVYNKLNYSEIESLAGQPMQEDGVVNILLIGNDSRINGEDGRSDAMILLSISKKTRTIYMTSLLRDMYVEIPGHDGNRLNAAYSFGGPELLLETVEQNLGITVNRYVQVNFEAFANLVEAVDGVDLELTTAEIEYVNGYLVEYNMLTNRPQGTDNMDTSVSGMVHLNGPQALAYCRNRYIGTDFGRTERQRKVLTEVIKKLPGAALTNGGDLINGLMPNLTTNLTRWECFRLSLMAGRLLTYDIVSDNIPQPGTYKDATIRSMSVLQVDFEANREYLREKLYGETSD